MSRHVALQRSGQLQFVTSINIQFDVPIELTRRQHLANVGLIQFVKQIIQTCAAPINSLAPWVHRMALSWNAGLIHPV